MKWNRNIFRSYSAPIFSQANIFCIVIYYIAFVIPFYLSFGTESFWMKQNFDVYPVSFTYTGDYVAYVAYRDSSTYTFSAISNVPGLKFTDSKIEILIDSSTSTSRNLVSGTLTTTSTTVSIQQIDLYLFVNTKVSGLQKQFIATSLVSLDFPSLGSVQVVGTMSLDNAQPLSQFSGSSRSTQPPFLFGQSYPSDFKTFKKNIEKNQILSAAYDSIFSPGSAYSFKVNLLSQGVNQVKYYPSFTQTLRNAFSQYFSLLIVTLFLAKVFLQYLGSHKVFSLQVEQKQFKALVAQQK